MHLMICRQGEAISQWTASYVLRRIHEFKPIAERPFVLALPTGGTPLGMYQQLVEFYQQGKLSFQHVVTFNLDEYVGLAKQDAQSYFNYMHTHFFDHVDLLPQNIHVLDGKATDLTAECQRYEATIQSYGGIELLIGGLGENGHIAFNEPTSSLSSRTRVTTLTDRTRLANARFFHNNPEAVPTRALTIGIGTILEAREVLILGQGYRKAEAIHQAIEGPITHLWPISALQLHPQATIVCDEAATLELKVKTVKHYQETRILEGL